MAVKHVYMDEKTHSRSTVGVNGLGPPIEAATAVPVENLQEVILQLKRDLDICKGKIKGYETLGAVFMKFLSFTER